MNGKPSRRAKSLEKKGKKQPKQRKSQNSFITGKKSKKRPSSLKKNKKLTETSLPDLKIVKQNKSIMP
jgi:hypothetical protein